MATVKQYATGLRDHGHTISLKLGYDLRQADLPVRALFTTVCMLLAGVVRLLFAKGVASEAEINTLFTNIAGAEYPQLPATAPPVGEDGNDPAPPDLGQ